MKTEKPKRAGIYVRVSTTDQNTGAQESELKDYAGRRGWKVEGIYRDRGISGAKASRPALDQLMGDCRRGRLDVVLVWKFDRFARSLRQLLTALELFRELHIDFVSSTEAIDTSLPHGELVFHILGALAQWERSIIGQRVRSGLQHARRHGKQLGRPPLTRLTREEVEQLRNDRKRSKTPFRLLSKRYGVSVWTAHRLCRGTG